MRPFSPGKNGFFHNWHQKVQFLEGFGRVSCYSANMKPGAKALAGCLSCPTTPTATRTAAHHHHSRCRAAPKHGKKPRFEKGLYEASRPFQLQCQHARALPIP